MSDPNMSTQQQFTDEYTDTFLILPTKEMAEVLVRDLIRYNLALSVSFASNNPTVNNEWIVNVTTRKSKVDEIVYYIWHNYARCMTATVDTRSMRTGWRVADFRLLLEFE